ncbi:hypothetical protein F443_13948 [Phytophthora nicotianae P1569]|uniref:Uncharacterized protein n=1 Tax=Phytophthora nicotianae P1569 TaxID=1317065 RepID=V9ERJ2_PHYNI|nr:hypothetical protein F443_13948 [Phytophthora nicotianae P1569]
MESSDSLDAAFVNGTFQLDDTNGDGATGYLSSLGGEEWDPEVLLSAMDSDFGGGYGPELLPITPFQWVNAPNVENTLIEESAPPQRKKTKLNYDPNKARNERRFQLIELRDEVKELEMKLKQLQIIRIKKKPTGAQHKKYRSNHTKSTGMSAVWKEFCFRQLEQRLRAERENIHLKKSCEREMEVVKGLRKLLYRHPSQRDIMYLGENTRTRRIDIPTGSLKQMAALIFDELSTGVENSYRIAEVVIEINSPVPTHKVTQKPLLRDAMNGMRMEVFDHHILPFDMRATGDAWWKHWHNYRGQSCEAGNVVAESFGLEFTDVMANTTATFYVQQILHRHVEDHRTVIVWNAYIEPFMFENERVSGVYFLEQSHVIIKPDDQYSSSEGAVPTRMSTCEIISPHFLDPKLKEDPKITALTDFVASSLSSNIMMRNEKIEDMLLDQSLRQRR